MEKAGRPVGLVTLTEVKGVPPEGWEAQGASILGAVTRQNLVKPIQVRGGDV